MRAVEKAREMKWAEFASRHGDSGPAMALYVARPRAGLALRAPGDAAGGMDYTPSGNGLCSTGTANERE